MKFFPQIPFLICLLVLIAKPVFAQEENPNPFDNGQPIGLVHANFYSGINQGSNPTAFEITRAYLGYKFTLSKEFSAKIQLDIGSPDDVSQFSLLRRFAYFKDAHLQYRKGKVTVRFGIIPLQVFKLQETIWGHRYIYKSIADEHSFGSSADLGASVNVKATSFLDVDFTLMNGEGYSTPQTDYSFKAGFGMTLRPWKGLIVRWYADLLEQEEKQWTLVNFVGYQVNNKIALGVEYDLKLNNSFENGRNQEVFSGYATYQINKSFQVFGRYDFVASNVLDGEDNPWDLADDGSAIIAGVEYRPIDKVKLSLNYQDWAPYAKNTDNEAYIFLNLEFRVW